jgi:hypothetical protein
MMISSLKSSRQFDACGYQLLARVSSDRSDRQHEELDKTDVAGLCAILPAPQ